MKRSAPVLMLALMTLSISAFKVSTASSDHTDQNEAQPQATILVEDYKSNKINYKDLLGCWTNSKEENHLRSPVKIYRPCSYKNFAPLRFRFRMDLKKNFKCSYLHQAPSDEHPMKDGTWSFNEDTKVLKIFDSNEEVVVGFKVETVGKKILKLKVSG